MKQLAIAAALLLTACHFHTGAVRAVEVIEFSTFQKIQSRGEVNAPNALGGQMHAVTDAVLVERTTDIHAHRGGTAGWIDSSVHSKMFSSHIHRSRYRQE